MAIARILRVLLARWVVILVSFVIAAVVGCVFAYYVPVGYTATAVVMVESRADPVAGGMQLMTPNFLATQVDVIKSSRVSEKVIKGLRLNENASLRDQFKDSQAQGTYAEWLARLLQRNLLAEPGRGTNVIRVSYSSSEAAFSALMANAFVTGYLDSVLEMRLEPAKRYSNFFDDRAKDLRENVEKTQTKLSMFLKEKGVVASDERQDTEIAKLSDLQSQVLQVQAQLIDAYSREAQGKGTPDITQEVLGNGLVSSIKSDIIRQESKLVEISSRLGERHPQVIDARNGLDELRSKLSVEIKRVTGAVGISSKIVKQRESELRNALDTQRSKVLRLKQTRDEIAVMQRDVEVAQRAYEAVQVRLNQSTLESQNQQSNISILNLAEIPNETKTQILIKNITKALLMAAGIAVLAGLVREFFDKRLRTVDDIVSASNLPILGVLKKADKRLWFRRKKHLRETSWVLRQTPLLIEKS
jgi:polysaccharide biosynthesis transport protein